MKKILVTGSKGFIGKNLIEALNRLDDVAVREFDIDDAVDKLKQYLGEAEVVFHLAGTNRPQREEEYETGNSGFTETIVEYLDNMNKNTTIVMSSSIQAELDNPYGRSKRKAEDILIKYSEKTGAKVCIYRLPNVFGKWCRPNYNSVVATFCYNISHDLDIAISDPNKELQLVYIDDVVQAFMSVLTGSEEHNIDNYYVIKRVFRITLGELAKKIYTFKDIRKSLIMPDLGDDLTKFLHATYLSYLDKDALAYSPEMKIDNRGNLFELLKSEHVGQIFISKSHKGVIRGNHYHNTKIEKFCVIQGTALIKLRSIVDNEILLYHVTGDKIEVVDIPPGYTHSIENTGIGELITLFWSNQIFDPKNPDTYFKEV